MENEDDSTELTLQAESSVEVPRSLFTFKVLVFDT